MEIILTIFIAVMYLIQIVVLISLNKQQCKMIEKYQNLILELLGQKARIIGILKNSERNKENYFITLEKNTKRTI